ncbi:ATP-dependent DNA helicase RecG, partial [Candidatus Saccharibacteria bacterium]|nr:ATP-dependent DNA helicase RecG [Candidatus Saccharibacteria bacterium]
ATPIPRSLALVVYGDLDISIMRDMPAGRLPIKTQLISEKDRAKIYAHIDEQISSGRQAYIVCPSIDMNDTSGQKAVTSEYERLQKTVFRHRRIGLMHGRLKSEEKTQLMADFSAGKIDILVATTVIEVGVHVENATIMLIESAERFGLATLHQLRGRVGRSEHQAYCYLIASNEAESSLIRLRAMERTSDGFRLAQIDLEARGAGERFGSRQHGEVDLIFANISDSKLIAQVRDAALAFLKTENIVEYPYTLEQVNRLKAVTSLD